MSSPAVFLAAGEQSGDLHGAELAAELRRRIPGVRLYGLGGSRMAAAGVELLADLDRLAILGFVEVVRHVPDLARLRRQVRRFLVEQGMDLLVPIDYPGFNLPLARYAHGKGIPVLYYIAPQVWAWHQSRARQLAEATDLVCVVLPFERDLLERWGVRTLFVGHPLLDHAPNSRSERVEVGDRLTLGLFPGSRRQEVERLLPHFMAAAEILIARFPDLDVLVARAADLDEDVYGDAAAVSTDVEEVVSRATAAITKSGTITLQLALAHVPMVVGYRVNWFTYQMARRLVKVDHIALVNLVAGRSIVPELVQTELRPDGLAAAVHPLLRPDSTERAAQVGGLEEVAKRLGHPGAAARVATECAKLLGAED